MATVLRDLYKRAEKKYVMTSLAGEGNLSNLVKWVHMLEDPETASFLHGQELIFTTGIGHQNTSWLIGFAKKLIHHGASGLVINIGPYIREIPQELLEYCNEKAFPLFTIPWITRIVDISSEFCRQIINQEETETTVAEAFRNLIFFPDKAQDYRAVLEEKEFNLKLPFRILAIALPQVLRFAEYEKMVMLHLTKALLSYSDRFSILKQDKNIIVVLQNFTNSILDKVLEKVYGLCETGDPAYKLRAGISDNEIGFKYFPKNYKRAIAVLNIAKKQNMAYLYYENSGIYQLLIEVEDLKVLRKLYEDTLGQLADYDEKHGTDYCYILKCYLDNNSSVEKVAKETYVHRNTINYKIKKIKEILRSELDYNDGFKLFLAYHIKDYLLEK